MPTESMFAVYWDNQGEAGPRERRLEMTGTHLEAETYLRSMRDLGVGGYYLMLRVHNREDAVGRQILPPASADAEDVARDRLYEERLFEWEQMRG